MIDFGGGSITGTNLSTAGGIFGEVVNDSTYNAFPGLTLLPNGHLFMVYRTGANHFSEDGIIKSRVSTDLGATWSAATTVHDPAGTLDARDPEITLLANNTILMIFFEANAGTDHKVYAMIGTPSGDSVSWGSKILLSESDFATVGEGAGGGTACACKPLQLASGKIVVFIYGYVLAADPRLSTAVISSTNNGATWGNFTVILTNPSSKEYSEANAVQLSSGNIVCICRSETEGYVRIVSTDNGVTWGSPTVVITQSNPGKPGIVRTALDNIFFVGRKASGANTHATQYAMSWDAGVTWTDFALWGTAIGVYASSVLLPSGTIATVIAFEATTTNSDIYFQEFIDEGVIGVLDTCVRANENPIDRTHWISSGGWRTGSANDRIILTRNIGNGNAPIIDQTRLSTNGELVLIDGGLNDW